MKAHTRELLIQKARELALGKEGPITRDEFTKLTGISRYFIEQLFPDRGWRELADLAGIIPHPSAHGRFSNADLDLLGEFHSVAKKVGKIPTLRQFNVYAKFSSSAIIRRFGGIRSILNPYKEWLMTNDPDSPFVELVATKSRHEVLAVPRSTKINGVVSSPEWNKGDGIVYGAPISFRGLRHAPVN